MTSGTRAERALVPCTFCGAMNRVELRRVDHRPRCGKCAKPILLDRPIRLSDADFHRVVAESQVPLLVDFYADRCGPCKIMAPLLDDLAAQRRGEVIVGKLDTDHNPTVATEFEIRSIPTLVLFRSGREASRAVGAVSRERLNEILESA